MAEEVRANRRSMREEDFEFASQEPQPRRTITNLLDLPECQELKKQYAQELYDFLYTVQAYPDICFSREEKVLVVNTPQDVALKSPAEFVQFALIYEETFGVTIETLEAYAKEYAKRFEKIFGKPFSEELLVAKKAEYGLFENSKLRQHHLTRVIGTIGNVLDNYETDDFDEIIKKENIERYNQLLQQESIALGVDVKTLDIQKIFYEDSDEKVQAIIERLRKVLPEDYVERGARSDEIHQTLKEIVDSRGFQYLDGIERAEINQLFPEFKNNASRKKYLSDEDIRTYLKVFYTRKEAYQIKEELNVDLFIYGRQAWDRESAKKIYELYPEFKRPDETIRDVYKELEGVDLTDEAAVLDAARWILKKRDIVQCMPDLFGKSDEEIKRRYQKEIDFLSNSPESQKKLGKPFLDNTERAKKIDQLTCCVLRLLFPPVKDKSGNIKKALPKGDIQDMQEFFREEVALL